MTSFSTKERQTGTKTPTERRVWASLRRGKGLAKKEKKGFALKR